MGDPNRASTLTIQERIMLHLQGHARQREDYAVPRAVTQSGIAEALAIRVAHASREVRKLVDGELAEERDAAVEGSKRHQKAYFLTAAGLQAAAALRQELGPEAAAAVVAHAATPRAAEEGPVHVLREFPKLRYFFGRAQELEGARKLLETRGVLVVLGIAGIGKSTFGARLQEELAGTRSTVWYQIHEYDTPASVLAPVARLLALLGRPKLELLTKRDAAVDLPQAKEVLMEGVVGLKVAVFIDDPQVAPPEALQALRVLREVAASQPEALKLIFLARMRPPIYDGRDVKLRKTVGELELAGLSREDVGLLLGAGDRPRDPGAVYDTTGGHPLFIELVRDAAGEGSSAGPDRRQIDRFLQDQIYSKLDRGEREALRRVVFVRRPVDPRVLLAPPATFESLLTLESRSLVRRDAAGRVTVHESIRDFVRRTLSEEEEQELSSSAYRALMGEVEVANRRDDPLYAIALLEDALRLAPEEEEVPLLVRLGGFHLAVAQYNQAAFRLEQASALMAGKPDMPSQGITRLLLGAVHSEAGHPDVAAQWLEGARELMEGPLAQVGPERGRVYLELAKWQVRYGTAAKARAWIDQAMQVGKALQHPFIIAEGEMLLSHVTPAREGLEHLERAVELAAANEFSPLLSLAHTTLSWHLVDLFGETDRAVRHANDGLEIATTLGNRVLIGGAHAALAKAHWRSGDLKAAQEHARRGMETAEKNFTERIVPMALVSTLLSEAGSAPEGERMARELLEAAEKYGSPMEVLSARRSLARALDVQGRYEEAIPLLTLCHETYGQMALSCDAPNHIAILDRMIRMEVIRGNREAARRWFDAAKARLPEVDSPIGGALQAMAFAHLRQVEDPALSASYYWRAAETWRKVGWRMLELKMLVDCSNVVAEVAKAGKGQPDGVPGSAEIEGRIGQLTEELSVPRPSPLTGSTLA